MYYDFNIQINNYLTQNGVIIVEDNLYLNIVLVIL